MRLLGLAAVFLGFFPGAVAARPAQGMAARPPLPGTLPGVTAFVNVTVIPMDSERVVPGQTVLVEGGWITAMGPVKQVRVPAGAVRIDGAGKFLMPGLADMHSHVAASERMLVKMVARGVTTIRDVSAIRSSEVLVTRRRAAAGEIVAPRIYTSGTWYTDPKKSIAQNVADYKAAGFDLIKIHDGTNCLRSSMMRIPLDGQRCEPGDFLVQSLRLDSLVEAARRARLPIVAHALLGGGLAYALRHRFASVEHLEGFPGSNLLWRLSELKPVWQQAEVLSAELADTVNITAAAAAVRRAHVWVCPTQFLVDYRMDLLTDTAKADTATPDSVITLLERTATARRRVIKALNDADEGILLLGTDGGVADVHKELQSLVRAGLTPYQALRTGTRNAAAYFGTEDRTGTVAVGKQADVVLLENNPLADIRQSNAIAGVMLRGRWFTRAALDQQVATAEGAQKKP